VPELRGDLVSDDPGVLRTKLFAAVVSTVLAELIATLGRGRSGVDSAFSAAAWRAVAEIVRGLPGGDDDRAALLRDPLPLKAMTTMRLAADPLEDRWIARTNPMAAA
jgi:hypothetical protein